MTPTDIRAIRATLKMTRAAFAREIGCTTETIERWEYHQPRDAPVPIRIPYYRQQLERLRHQSRNKNDNE